MKSANLYFLLILIFSIGCNKDKLKHATEKGANTASWLVDGTGYRTVGDVDGGPPVYAERSVSIDGNILTIRLRDGFTNTVTIKITGYTGAGLYQLNTLKTYAVLKSTSYSGSNEFTKLGYVDITRDDRSEPVLSGRFEFLIPGPEGKMVAVTKGRFDIGD